MTRLPKLLDDIAAENDEAETLPDAARSQEIETLSKQIPRLISLLPDILHRNRATDPRHVAALEEMTKELLKLVERAQPLLLVSTFRYTRNHNNLMNLIYSTVPNSTTDLGRIGWRHQNQPCPRNWICPILAEHRGIGSLLLFSLGFAVLDMLFFCNAPCFAFESNSAASSIRPSDINGDCSWSGCHCNTTVSSDLVQNLLTD